MTATTSWCFPKAIWSPRAAVAEVVRTTGAKTIGEAFSKLSRKVPAAGAEKPS